MNDTAVHAPTGLLTCRTCGADDFDAVSDGEATNFFCRVCCDCWHVELGWVRQVDPATCPGCAHQPLCLAINRQRS